MSKAGSEQKGNGNGKAAVTPPLWLLAEVTYACPLQCVYCSNPAEFAKYKGELSTEEWLRVFREARDMGAAQLGFSGGEPLVRRDLETLIGEARQMGYYTNLITSGIGMTEDRIRTFRDNGLDHIQISFQASNQVLNDYIGGSRSFEKKLEMARLIKRYDYPMVLNVVIHRQNIDQMDQILDMAADLDADYVELANTQYYGWAWVNREHLLPTRDQLERAEAVANEYQERYKGRMKIFYVVPDYYETRPKACMNGWGSTFLNMTPDGTAMPCHAAGQLPGMTFPNAREHSVRDIWYNSDAFNRFRGFDWMKEPCRSCPEKYKDFGGCRCQAFMLTGDPAMADPVCDKSPDHHKIVEIIEAVNRPEGPPEPAQPLRFRNPKNSKAFIE